jgi:hypothetical protein
MATTLDYAVPVRTNSGLGKVARLFIGNGVLLLLLGLQLFWVTCVGEYVLHGPETPFQIIVFASTGVAIGIAALLVGCRCVSRLVRGPRLTGAARWLAAAFGVLLLTAELAAICWLSWAAVMMFPTR